MDSTQWIVSEIASGAHVSARSDLSGQQFVIKRMISWKVFQRNDSLDLAGYHQENRQDLTEYEEFPSFFFFLQATASGVLRMKLVAVNL